MNKEHLYQADREFIERMSKEFSKMSKKGKDITLDDDWPAYIKKLLDAGYGFIAVSFSGEIRYLDEQPIIKVRKLVNERVFDLQEEFDNFTDLQKASIAPDEDFLRSVLPDEKNPGFNFLSLPKSDFRYSGGLKAERLFG